MKTMTETEASPAPNGGAAVELLATAVIDEDFSADVLAALEAVVSEAPAWPAD